MLYSGLCSAIAAALTALIYPKIFHGPLVDADPFIITKFLPRINEALPVYKAPLLWPVIAEILQPLLALGVCLLALKRKPAIYAERSTWQLLFFYALTGALYVSQQRFYYYWYPTSVLMLSPMLAALFTPKNPNVQNQWPASWIAKKPELQQMLWRVPVLFVIMILPMALVMGFHKTPPEAQQKLDRCNSITRKWAQAGKLDDLGHGKSLILFVDTDLGGEIMFWTPHRIVASNYHREGKGIEYMWDTDDITSPAKFRRHLAERKVDALLICPNPNATDGSILEGLQEGTIHLNWLKPVKLPLPPTHAEPLKGSTPAVFLVRHGD